MNSFGDYIRKQRELRQITQEEVSEVTKVSLKYLNALENDRPEFLPAKPFIVGFLRVYSKYLGLDDDAVVTRYLDWDIENSKINEEESSPKMRKSLKRRIAIPGILLLTIMSFLLAVLL